MFGKKADGKWPGEWLWVGGAGTILALLSLSLDGRASDILRLLLGYAGFVVWLVLGTLIWLQRIQQHPDLGPEGRELNKNSVVVAAAFLGVIVSGLLVVALATVAVFKTGTPTALLWALGSLFAGGFLGFLFSLPKVSDPPPGTPPSRWQVNTSLNRIAEWLTGIIVGVSLVNARTVYEYFVRALHRLGEGLVGSAGKDLPGAYAFAAGLIVFFALLGLLGTYLLTRLWLSTALAQAEQVGTTVFSDVKVNERDIFLLENEARSFSEKEQELTGAALDVAQRLSTLGIDKLRTWREFAAWAKAKSSVGQHDDALLGYERAVQLYPENPALHLEFAVALLLAVKTWKKDVKTPDDEKRIQDLRNELRAQLVEAYQRLNRKTPAEVTKNVFKSLTFHWLYVHSPRGFTEAIRYGEEYVKDPRLLPSGGIWVNLACAYGQKALWLMQESGQTSPDPALRDLVKIAIQEALRLDTTWNLRFQLLLQKSHPLKIGPKGEFYAEENDLESFEADREIRILIGLPPDVRPAVPESSSSSLSYASPPRPQPSPLSSSSSVSAASSSSSSL